LVVPAAAVNIALADAPGAEQEFLIGTTAEELTTTLEAAVVAQRIDGKEPGIFSSGHSPFGSDITVNDDAFEAVVLTTGEHFLAYNSDDNGLQLAVIHEEIRNSIDAYREKTDYFDSHYVASEFGEVHTVNKAI